MRLIALVVLAACGGHARNEAVSALPPSPPSSVRAAQPSIIEPGIGRDACVIGGSTLAVTTPITLCAAPGQSCFGRLTDAWVYVERLAIASSSNGVIAHLVYARSGVTVSGVGDHADVALYFQQPRVVAGFFVPVAAMHVDAASPTEVLLAIDPGDDVMTAPRTEMHVRAACDEITSDAPSVTFEDVEQLAKMGVPIEQGMLANVTLALRRDPIAPVIATIARVGYVRVYRRERASAEVVIPVSDGYVFGWTSLPRLGPVVGGGHRTRTPSLRQGSSFIDTVCDHPVDVILDVQGQQVRALSIDSGVSFDPARVEDTVRDAVELERDVRPYVRSADIADCTHR